MPASINETLTEKSGDFCIDSTTAIWCHPVARKIPRLPLCGTEGFMNPAFTLAKTGSGYAKWPDLPDGSSHPRTVILREMNQAGQHEKKRVVLLSLCLDQGFMQQCPVLVKKTS